MLGIFFALIKAAIEKFMLPLRAFHIAGVRCYSKGEYFFQRGKNHVYLQ